MVRASKQRLLVLTVRMHKTLAGWLKFASDSVEAKAIFAKAHDPMRECVNWATNNGCSS